MFLARVEWLPVTSRSHVTDKCKISIRLYINFDDSSFITEFFLIVLIIIDYAYIHLNSQLQ